MLRNVNETNTLDMNLRIFSFLVLICLLSGKAFSQQISSDNLKIKKSEFKTAQEEGFKEAWKNIQQANEYYKAGVGTFALARDLYLFAHQYNPDNNVLNYRIGVCYLYTDDKYEALKYLRKAYDTNPDITTDIHFYLGRAYHLVLEFDKAKEHYLAARDVYSGTGQVDMVIQIDKLIGECENGKSIVENPVRVIITNMGDSVNSVLDDYLPVFADHDSTLYITSRRYNEKHDKRNPYDNKYFEDAYACRLGADGWLGAKPLSKKINTRHNDAVLGVSPDGNSLYIYRGYDNGGDIYVSHFNPKKGDWKKPKPLPRKINSKQAEGSVFFTASGDTMYFISSNEDLTQGGKDIMFTVKNEKGRWQDPRDLGSLVNTRYDEEGVYLNPAGNELWFSSRGHNTMGGFDVFHSERLDDGTWSDPENVGYPINTADDDLFFRESDNGKYAYYSTIRENGIGAKDIYKVVFLGSEKELMLSNEDILIAGLPDTLKTGFFTIPEPVHIDSFYYLTGRVLDKETNEPILAKLEFIDVGRSQVIATALSADSGRYRVKFPEPKNYGVEILAKDYLFFLDAIDMTKASTDEPTVKDFYLEKLEIGTKVVLENIYFETNKATLKPDSYEQLNQVVKFMKNNESVKLEISGHTDNTGSLKYNTKLSEERAKAVVDYLVTQGIDASRLEWKGYAFTQPIAPNDTAEGREKNRRVEFKVIGK